MSSDWLPPLVLLADSGGVWDAYEQALYGWFREDFVDSVPSWPNKRVGLKRYPLSKGKEATFWHFISTGDAEAERIVEIPRCERIRWPRPVMEAFASRKPEATDRIVWWRNQRGTEWRYLLALPDFSYLLVVVDRGEYVLPWTQYFIEKQHRRDKYRSEYTAFWQAQNS